MRTSATAPLITRPDRTIHFLTDVHAGIITTLRTDKLIADAPLAMRSAPVLRVHGGDVTNEDPANGSVNTAAFDATAGAFITGFADGAPYAVGIGNHDVLTGTRTAAQYCTSMASNGGIAALTGRTDLNQVFSLGTWGKAIVIGDDRMYGIAFLQATLDWLEATLVTNAAYPCLVFAHPPLEGTFGSINTADATNVPSSTDVTYFAKLLGDSHDTYIRTLIGSHANLKAWVSGHCHPHPTLTVDGSGNQTVVQGITMGGRTVAHIVGGAGYYTHPFVDLFDPVYCTYLTYLGDATGGTLEVRHRDAQSHSWVPSQGQLVQTVSVG